MFNFFQINKNLDRADRSIIGVAGLLLAFTLVLLFNDETLLEYFDLTANTETPVAVITTTSNDIRRKQDQSVVWSHLKAKSSLFSDDTIYSGDSSNLEFQLTTDKTKVSLGAQTLIKLTRDSRRNNSLSVLHGRASVSLGKNKSLNLNIAGKTLQVTNTGEGESSAIQINADSADSISSPIKVLSGQIEVKVVGSQDPAVTITNQTEEVRKPASVEEQTAVQAPPIIEPVVQKLEPYVAKAEPLKPVDFIDEATEAEGPILEPVSEPEDSTQNDMFRLSSRLGASQYIASTAAGGRLTRPSKLNFGGETEWVHLVTSAWEVGFLFGFLHTDLDSYSRQAVSGMPATLFHLGIETSFKPMERLKLTIRAEYDQKLYISNATGTSIQFNRLWAPTFTFKAIYDFYKKDDFSIGLGMIGAGALPPTSDSYTISFGTALGGALRMESRLSETIKLSGEASYVRHTQNTSTIMQTRVEQNIDIGLTFSFGTAKKQAP